MAGIVTNGTRILEIIFDFLVRKDEWSRLKSARIKGQGTLLLEHAQVFFWLVVSFSWVVDDVEMLIVVVAVAINI